MSLSSPWRRDGDDLILAIRLTPRNARDALGGLWTDEKDRVWLQAQVRAVPEKGKANDALVALVAKALSVPAGRITLEAGDTSRLKRLRIAGGGAQDLEHRLTGLLAS